MKDSIYKRSSKNVIIVFLICFMMLAEAAVPVFALEAENISEEPAAANVEETVAEDEIAIEEKAAPLKSTVNGEYTIQAKNSQNIYVYDDVSDYYMEDESIATVTYESWYDRFIVVGSMPGTTTLKVITKYGTEKTYIINVTAPKMEFLSSSIPYGNKMERGSSKIMSVLSNCDSYEWTVSDPKIFRIESGSGYGANMKKVVAIGKGTATITVTNEFDGQVSVELTSTANDFLVEDSTNPTYSMEVGSYQWIHVSYPYESDECTYEIANPDIAKVEIDGAVRVWGLEQGDTTMTVTNEYGESVVCNLHVYATLDKLQFEEYSYTVYLGQPVQLKYNIAPAYHNNKLIFSAGYDNDGILSISDTGVVTGLKTGTAYCVRVEGEDGSVSTCTVYVKKPYFSKSSYSLYKNKTLQLKLYGASKDTKWSSSNTSVATVSSSGKITAKKAGTAKITATTNGYRATTTIKVSNPKISKTKLSIWGGKSTKLTITGGVGTVKWTSSNKKVAAVSSKGTIVAKKAGTATISAKVSGVTLKCKVTVKGPKLSATKKSLIAKQTYKLSVKGATSKIKWSSSKKSVATVSSKGTVTAKKPGTTTITAKVGGKKLKCKITVKANQCTYSVSTDVNQYDYGEPTVVLKKAYFDGNKLKADVYVMNNRIFRADKFDWIIYKLYDNNGKLVASKKFKNVRLGIKPGGYKKITLTFSGSSIKRKNTILNKGVDDYWSYWYTYTY